MKFHNRASSVGPSIYPRQAKRERTAGAVVKEFFRIKFKYLPALIYLSEQATDDHEVSTLYSYARGASTVIFAVINPFSLGDVRKVSYLKNDPATDVSLSHLRIYSAIDVTET